MNKFSGAKLKIISHLAKQKEPEAKFRALKVSKNDRMSPKSCT